MSSIFDNGFAESRDFQHITFVKQPFRVSFSNRLCLLTLGFIGYCDINALNIQKAHRFERNKQ